MIAQLNANVVVDVLSKLPFWGTIIAACTVIGLGFFFQKKKLIFDNWEKVLAKLLIYVGLPALIFRSFMIDLSPENAINMVVLLVLGIVFYFAISLGTRVFFLKTSKSLQDTLSMCVAFSSTIYFGLPLAQALQGADNLTAVNEAANIFNVGFWAFMCGYALYIVRRKVEGTGPDGKPLTAKEFKAHNKFTKKDFKSLILSPIILALLIGFILWIMQLIPGIDVIKVRGNGWGTIADGDYSPTRVDALIPGMAQILAVLAPLPTPLAWLAVGSVVAKGNVKEAVRSKIAWYSVAIKNMIIPLVGLGFMAVFAVIGHSTGWYSISAPGLVVIILMLASPTATTITSYAIMYDKEALKASQVCTLTTIMAVVTMPIWAILTTLVSETSIFG